MRAPANRQLVILLGVIFFVAGLIIVYFLTGGDYTPPEDTREVREYGDGSCIYNVDIDVVEACW